MVRTSARRIWLSVGLAVVALTCISSSVAFADDDHSGPGRGGGERGRDGDNRGRRDRDDREDAREVRFVAPNNQVITINVPTAPSCARVDPSVATIDSVFGQFMSGGGLSLTQAALIGNALYLSADEVQELPFERLIAMTQCAGVSLDTLSNILSGA